MISNKPPSNSSTTLPMTREIRAGKILLCAGEERTARLGERDVPQKACRKEHHMDFV
jgi:hypothetical protein